MPPPKCSGPSSALWELNMWHGTAYQRMELNLIGYIIFAHEKWLKLCWVNAETVNFLKYGHRGTRGQRRIEHVMKWKSIWPSLLHWCLGRCWSNSYCRNLREASKAISKPFVAFILRSCIDTETTTTSAVHQLEVSVKPQEEQQHNDAWRANANTNNRLRRSQ